MLNFKTHFHIPNIYVLSTAAQKPFKRGKSTYFKSNCKNRQIICQKCCILWCVLTVLVNFVACNFGRVTIHDATAKDRSGYYPAGTADISIKGLTARCLHLAFSSNLSANVMNPDWSDKKTFHTTSISRVQLD